MEFVPHVIDGQGPSQLGGAVRLGRPVDPWTREPWAEVALSGAGRAACRPGDRAVQAARRAFDRGPWPKMGHAERGALLHRFPDAAESFVVVTRGPAVPPGPFRPAQPVNPKLRRRVERKWHMSCGNMMFGVVERSQKDPTTPQA